MKWKEITNKLTVLRAKNLFAKSKIDKAIKLYHKAAENGDVTAQFELASIYYKGIVVKKDYKKSAYWFEKAAEQGDKNAQKRIANMYYLGIGVKQDYNKAVKWYEIVAESEDGNIEIQQCLGLMYYNGDEVEKNYIKAVYWFEKVAKQGDVITQGRLGRMYFEGGVIKPNYEKAEKWLKKVIEEGNIQNQELLAINQQILATIYLFGLGNVAQNIEEAEKLFQQSLKNGEKSSKYYVDTLAKIKNKSIKTIENIAEYDEKKSAGLEGILVKPDNNFYIYAHTLYDLETFNKIKRETDNILRGIPEVNPDKFNEFEVFNQICKRIAYLVSYDCDAIDENNHLIEDESIYCTSNLIGAVLKKKCVCSGYAELLRNLCACRGIECIYVGSNKHTFNQVKIGENWYYFDITSLIDSIRGHGVIDIDLKSKESIQAISDSYIVEEGQTTYESPNDFIKDLKERKQLKEAQSTHQTSMEGIAQKALSGMTKGTIYEAENQLRKDNKGVVTQEGEKRDEN